MSLNVLGINPAAAKTVNTLILLVRRSVKMLNEIELNYSIKFEQNMHSCGSFQACAVFNFPVFVSQIKLFTWFIVYINSRQLTKNL